MNTKTNEPAAEYIDATPTWVGILPVLLAAAENGSKPALAELQRMARQADLLQAYLADEKLAARELDALREDYEIIERRLAASFAREGGAL